MWISPHIKRALGADITSCNGAWVCRKEKDGMVRRISDRLAENDSGPEVSHRIVYNSSKVGFNVIVGV